jgi:hypothetical protein
MRDALETLVFVALFVLVCYGLGWMLTYRRKT